MSFGGFGLGVGVEEECDRIKAVADLPQFGIRQFGFEMMDVTVGDLASSSTQTVSGVIIAPDARLNINPSGSLPLNFCGALMVNSLTVNGNLNLHYDESLGRLLNPPRPSGAMKGTDGAFGFNVPGDSGLTFVVQASTNLVDWTSVATNLGPFSFSDTNANLIDKQFYRVVWP